MFDLDKTLELIRGALLEPQETWVRYRAENRPWTETAALLTGPLIVASVVLAGLLGWIFRSHHMFMGGPGGIVGLIVGLLFAAAGVALASFIFSFFAGVFKGEPDFGRSLAAVSLAAVPAYVGSVLGTLPWIGWLLSLGLGIVTLVFLYRIIPLYLSVPEDKRVLHYAVSIVVTIVASALLGMLLGVGTMSARDGAMMGAGHDVSHGRASGLFGDIGRQAEIIERAEQDRYDPPRDGRITRQQMDRYLDVMRKTSDLRTEQDAALEELGRRTEEESEFSLRDIGRATGSLMGAATAEMEVVKTGDGNWAEHLWVKEQLRGARIQKDLNEAVRHNHALYQEYAEQLQQLEQ
jgi:hypothetical protein